MIDSAIPSIAFPKLEPKTARFEGIDDNFINSDGIIALAKAIDTPEAKAVYRAFRKRLVEAVHSFPDLPAVKQREKAILQAIEDAGWRINWQPAPGGTAA